ncbi:MAG: ASKHA domain-containing protein [Candidatus Aminicenantaceae bacterium]
MSYKLKIVSLPHTISTHSNDILSVKIQEAGINLNTYCNMKGLCGKCFVEILEGDLPPLTETEKFLIEHKNLNENFRLACMYKIKSDLKISIPDESIRKKAYILTKGIQSPFELNPAIKKYILNLKKPDLSSPRSLLQLLEESLRKRKFIMPIDLIKNLGQNLENNDYHINAVFHRDKEIIDIEQISTQSKNFGIAIDVGTTTLVLQLVSLETGEAVDILTNTNSQVKYGADVISRISFGISNENGLNKLQNTLLEDINKMIKKILKKNNINPENVYEIATSGNTVMNHLLLGIPVNTLAFSPYHPVFTKLPELNARELGLNINKNGKVYIAPNIQGFVGGDISSGLIASDFANIDGNYIYIDIGTNGEIVLKKGNQLTATSTAAGPAFEGMNISCGMSAVEGAIYKAESNEQLKTYTINNKKPMGICGTGLIDIISIFLDKGLISSRGKIETPSHKIQIEKNIFLIKKDIAQLQMAIAAIKAGITLMLKENGMTTEELDGIYIAGAFGNFLNIQNAIRIGLLPEMDEKKINFIGNASLSGAQTLLLSVEARKNIEKMVKKIKYISLATKSEFQNIYINSLTFPKD